MNIRTLSFFASLFCLSFGLSAQCLTAFPVSAGIGTCVDGAPGLCVEQIPDSLNFEWVIFPGDTCTSEDYSGQTLIRFTPEANACGYGFDPVIAFSGGLGISMRAQNPTNCGLADGWVQIGVEITDSVTVSITRDNAPFLTDTFTGSVTYENLPQGLYRFDVRRPDPFCRSTMTYDLQAPQAEGLNVDVWGPNVICLNNPQPIEAFVEGGTPPFMYHWSTGDSMVASITLFEEGYHDLTVTDANGCQDTDGIETVFGPFYWIEGNITDADCDGSPTGAIDITVNGEDEDNLQFFWNDLMVEGVTDRTDLAPGTYTLTTTSFFDGCTEFWSFTVGQSGDLEVSLSSSGMPPNTNLLCTGEELVISTSVSGGTGNYTYLWSDGSSNPMLIVNSPGTYGVTVNDGGGCQNAESIFIFEPNWPDFEAIITQPDCDQENGSIEITWDPAFILPISWSDGQEGPLADSLGAGSYTATVSLTHCDTVLTFTLENSLPGLEILSPQGDTITCNQPQVTMQASLVGPQYTYAWIDQVNDTIGTGFSVEVDTGSTYQLYVTDQTAGCTGFATQFIEYLVYPVALPPVFNPFQTCETPASLLAPLDPEEELITIVTGPDGMTETVAGGDSIVLPQVGNYDVVVRSVPRGCESMYTFVVDDSGQDCGFLDGRLYLTENCTEPATGELVPGYLVRIERADGSGSPTLVPTDNQGYWRADLQAGDYLVEAQPFFENLYEACPPLSVALAANQYGSSLDVGMIGLVDCAAPRVDVNIPLLRRCFNNPIHITYFNDGPELLPGAQLLIELDSFLFYQSADPMPDQVVDGFTLVYDLGDLPAFSGGSVTVNAIVSCAAVLGQSHCVLAQIPVATPCPEPQGWSGATVDLEAACDDDSLRFQISNITMVDMTVPLEYVIVEDGLMLSPAPLVTDPLEGLEEMYLTVPANGSTYQLITNQEPNSPGSPQPTLAVEGCGVNEQGAISLFYLNQLSLGDEELSWLDLECQNNIGAYDPNDKQAIPRGYGDEHFVDADQRLEYTIRFQNTGTDTAFHVVLRDTLTSELDLTTFLPGAASHDFTYLVDSNRVLEVTFPGIMLPDSFVAPLASQGAFQFSIKPILGLSEGTRIENRAGIYFDFNEPVITNAVFHTIGKDFLEAISNSVTGLVPPQPLFKVYPNPSYGWIQLEMDFSTEQIGAAHLYDQWGRRLRIWDSVAVTDRLELGGLPAGQYHLHLIDAAQRSLGVRSLTIR